MAQIVIGSSRRQLVLLLVVSLAFVVTGVAMIFDGKWFGLLAVLFFGACAAVFMWQLLQTRPRLTIDERGIEDRTLGVGRIEWRDIRAAALNSISGNAFISLELNDTEKYLQRLSAVRRQIAKANRAIGFSEFNVNLAHLEITPHEAFDLLARYCDFDRKNLGLHE